MSIVLFDLDETLINGDSASLWSAFMLEVGLVDNAFLSQERAIMQKYSSGKMSMSEYMAFTLTPLRALSQQKLADYVAHFVDKYISSRFYPQALEKINDYKQANRRLIIISATADFIVTAIAKKLVIQEVIAVQTEVVDGCYTGKTIGVLSYQQGKVERLKDYLGNEYEGLIRTATFYSDSCNDLPLLNEVAYPKVVNPDEMLRTVAEHSGWPILYWH
ncbi:HAD superfamily hydrolase (TIGR01490 family) [Nicoletella semolina]|uniref:HAD superfamily hydrolase (TIGR01490 family) n=1 Tax=Nicoletella semolina TaxID=271160 RepID=A0A4R2N736_9PAST|nr:HAD family hydrolase [Nicoletella semolina]MDH2924738.1 hypothetical protein [Nicoletella semolina]TCP16638.1 HAD superfamily hydrolase (TIGR01490 family) [Nicoletella semolina]